MEIESVLFNRKKSSTHLFALMLVIKNYVFIEGSKFDNVSQEELEEQL